MKQINNKVLLYQGTVSPITEKNLAYIYIHIYIYIKQSLCWTPKTDTESVFPLSLTENLAVGFKELCNAIKAQRTLSTLLPQAFPETSITKTTVLHSINNPYVVQSSFKYWYFTSLKAQGCNSKKSLTLKSWQSQLHLFGSLFPW